jgi:hypothetical protein
MDSAGVVWAVILLVAIPLLGIVAAPWLVYPITKFGGVAVYLYLLPLQGPPPAMRRSIGWSGGRGQRRARCSNASWIRLIRLRPNTAIRLMLRHHPKTRLLDGGKPQQWNRRTAAGAVAQGLRPGCG